MKISSALGVLLIATTCSSVHAADTRTLRLSVAPGELHVALNAFSQQAGREIIFRMDEVDSIRSGGVRGSLPVEDALTALLLDTGFTYIIDSSGAIAIIKTAADKSPRPLTASLQMQADVLRKVLAAAVHSKR